MDLNFLLRKLEFKRVDAREEKRCGEYTHSFIPWLTLNSTFLNLHGIDFVAGFERATAVDAVDDDVGEHGEEVPNHREHLSERIRGGRDEICKRGVRVTEEVDQRRRQEHTSRELSSQHQERVVPAEEVRGDSSQERGEEHDDQTIHLNENQPFRVQVHRVRAGGAVCCVAKCSRNLHPHQSGQECPSHQPPRRHRHSRRSEINPAESQLCSSDSIFNHHHSFE